MMTSLTHTFGFRMLALGLCAIGSFLVAGCGQPEAFFRLSGIEILLTEEALVDVEDPEPLPLEDVSSALEALLGTPDAPNIPNGLEEDVADLLDIGKLERAAGPVVTDEDGLTVSGLYRQHCAHCHGLSGDGGGPTAPFLNPYPRDYRLGSFKFKSTPIGFKPTNADLHRIMDDGIPGTAMPSFRLLESRELDALVDYVMYLSIRGQVEDKLFAAVGYDEFSTEGEYLLEVTSNVMREWVVAEEAVEPVPPPSDAFDWEHAAELGEDLYFTSKANCYTCHGPTQLGDGERGDYDDWTKDWAYFNGEMRSPEDMYETNDEGEYVLTEDGDRIFKAYGLDAFEMMGALPPRAIIPRNFRQGVFRFGRRPVDVYRRVRHGIEGTPMPGNAELSVDEAWYLVYYIRSLQYEALSEPEHFDLENLRERM